MADYTNSQISALIDEHIHVERDRELMKRRLCDGIVYERLGWEFSLSDRQVKNIVSKCMQILIQYL